MVWHRGQACSRDLRDRVLAACGAPVHGVDERLSVSPWRGVWPRSTLSANTSPGSSGNTAGTLRPACRGRREAPRSGADRAARTAAPASRHRARRHGASGLPGQSGDATCRAHLRHAQAQPRPAPGALPQPHSQPRPSASALHGDEPAARRAAACLTGELHPAPAFRRQKTRIAEHLLRRLIPIDTHQARLPGGSRRRRTRRKRIVLALGLPAAAA